MTNLRCLRGVLIAVAMVLVLAACALPPPAPITAPMATPAAAPTAEPPTTVAAAGGLPVAVAYNLGEATIVQERFPEETRFRRMPVRLNGIIAAPSEGDGPFPVARPARSKISLSNSGVRSQPTRPPRSGTSWSTT